MHTGYRTYYITARMDTDTTYHLCDVPYTHRFIEGTHIQCNDSSFIEESPYVFSYGKWLDVDAIVGYLNTHLKNEPFNLIHWDTPYNPIIDYFTTHEEYNEIYITLIPSRENVDERGFIKDLLVPDGYHVFKIHFEQGTLEVITGWKRIPQRVSVWIHDIEFQL